MAIVVTNVDNGANDTPGATQASASIAFQNNTLYILSTSVRGGVTPTTSAPSGGGLTWTSTSGTSPVNPFMNQWRGFTSSGASTGSVTFTVNGGPSTCKWIVDEFTGVNTTTPVVQNTALASSNNSTPIFTLSAFADAVNNVAYGVFADDQTEGSAPTLEGGWTQLVFNNTVTTGAQTMFSEYKVGQDTTVQCDWFTSVEAWSGNAFEIAAASAAVTRKLRVVTSPQRW